MIYFALAIIFPRQNLRLFKNSSDLVNNGKFPKLSDTRLNLIIGVCQVELINYEKISKPACSGELFAGKCK